MKSSSLSRAGQLKFTSRFQQSHGQCSELRMRDKHFDALCVGFSGQSEGLVIAQGRPSVCRLLHHLQDEEGACFIFWRQSHGRQEFESRELFGEERVVRSGNRVFWLILEPSLD